MSAVIFDIRQKVKPSPVANTQADNFVLGEGEPISAQVVLDNPNVSLYCLDDAGKQAIFVETPPEVDLAHAPFYYMAQYDHAFRVVAISYDTFHQIADEVVCGSLILLHSVGRCGSTLISQALNTADGVLSLSEPDIYTQIHLMRFLDRTRDDEYRRLLRSCTRLYARNTPTLALKFRGMCLHIGDLLYQALPDAKNLFLYRNADAWARSMGIEFLRVEERTVPSTNVPLHRRSIAPLSVPFAARHGYEASRVEMSALMWLSLMDQYVALHEQGVPFLAVRYEDIRAQPQRVLAAIFAYCGLHDARIERAYDVFGRDSQEGTVFSQASRQEQARIPLSADENARFAAVLAEHPVIQSPDFIAPGTLMLDEA